MIPVEAVVLILLVVFGVVGLGRTMPRELGATMGFLGLLLGLEILGDRLGPIASRGFMLAGFPMAEDMAAWSAYSIAIASAVYFVYQGETLTFNAVPTPGPMGKLLDFCAGILNGWLVVGSWWYYTDKLGYPIQRAALFMPPLSDRAQRLVELTPMAVLPDERTLLYLAGGLAGLILLKVMR